jgi:hypothetical protein
MQNVIMKMCVRLGVVVIMCGSIAACGLDDLVENAGVQWQTGGKFTADGKVDFLELLGIGGGSNKGSKGGKGGGKKKKGK